MGASLAPLDTNTVLSMGPMPAGPGAFGSNPLGRPPWNEGGMSTEGIPSSQKTLLLRRPEMTVRVGINGFGRIGRDFLRGALERGTDVIDVVAINDITDTATLANLLQCDSTYGPLRERVHHTDDSIVVGGTTIRVTAQRDPAALDRRAVGVDIVIESTGRFSTREAAAAHLTGGARKVILLSPGKGIDANPRARGERRDLQPGPAPDHLECILYDELRRADGVRAARGVRNPAWPDDYDPQLRQRSGDPGLPAQGPPARLVGRGEPDPDKHGRGQGP